MQVIQNLIDNAVKYAPAGSSVVIEVHGRRHRRGGHGAAPARRGASLAADPRPRRRRSATSSLRIADDGPGIAREHLPRLTERFYRVEGQKSGERPGTGLGLAIVKHIVNRHRGGLTVESAPGEGTAFGVYLPTVPEACALTELARPA